MQTASSIINRFQPRMGTMRTLVGLAGLATFALVGGAAQADGINYSKGFAQHSNLVYTQQTQGPSWNPFQGTNLVLTTNDYGYNGAWPFEAEAVFTNKPVSITTFNTSFNFLITFDPNIGQADGFTFVIQNAPNQQNLVGQPGGGLGYAGIPNSVAIKFDIWQNWTGDVNDPSANCTDLELDGTYPVGGTDLTPYGIDMHSGDVFQANLSYNGTVLKVKITDTLTAKSATQSYTIDIPSQVGSSTAYVGFTGGTGACVALEQILSWTYNSQPTLTSISATPDSVPGTVSATGTVSMTSPVSQDTAVALNCLNPAASVPTSVTIPAGSASVTFPIATTAVTATQTGSLIATLGGVVQKTTLNVRPIGVKTFTVAANYIPEGSATTATLTLEAPAAPGSVTLTLTSDTPSLAPVPTTLTIPAGQTSVTFPITVGPVTANTRVIFKASANNVSASTTLTVWPVKPQTLTLSPQSVLGGNGATAILTLNAPAPATGKIVTLTVNHAAAGVPATVLVAAGQTTASFPVTTQAVNVSTQVQIEASAGGANAFCSIVVRAPGLTALSVPASIASGQSASGSVSLEAAAPAGGVTVRLLSSNTNAANVPASLTIAAGQTSATFSVTTKKVSSDTAVTITGSENGTTASANTTVTH